MDKPHNHQPYYKVVRAIVVMKDTSQEVTYVSFSYSHQYNCSYIIDETTYPQLKGSKFFVFKDLILAKNMKNHMEAHRKGGYNPMLSSFAILKGTVTHPTPCNDVRLPYYDVDYKFFWKKYPNITNIHNPWYQGLACKRKNTMIATQGTYLVDSFTPIAVIDE